MYFHKPQVPPRLYGSFQDRQYAIWDNLEKIYGIDHESEALIMPGFWGLPPLDYSKYGNHGTNHGATYKDGSLDFDAANDYIDVTTVSADILTVGTVSVRMKFDSTTDGTHHVFSSRKGDWGDSLGIYNEWSAFKVEWIDRGAPFDTGYNFIVDTWYNVDLPWDGITLNTYVNGVYQSTHDGATSLGQQTVTYIGRYVEGGHYWNGPIGEVRVSNVVRTADQIALFHDLPWALYQPVSRPIYFFMAAGEDPSPGPGLMALML